jgi:kinesin family member 18/19
MDTTTPKSCPYTVTVRRNPPRRARATPLITPFPNEEMLSNQPSQNPTTSTTSENNENLKNPSENENLKVFLRIRPSQVQPPNQAPRARAKTAWPKTQTKNITVTNNSKKKSSSASCISINDSESVTLLVPSDLQDAKRVKSETYGGFTHVFPSDSSQVIIITVIFRHWWYFLQLTM